MSTAFPAEPTDAARGVLSISQITAQLKGMVEQEFGSVWVSGEISNFSRPQSGHCYLTLKDDAAQLRAVLWRGTASKVKFDLHDGLEVVCRGHLDVYPPRGSYQLVIEKIEPLGVGALELALRKLRERLEKEGLFRADRKRVLPRFPRRIGFVTSPTGAAIRDFLEVLRRRWSGIEVLVFPTRVQGDGAAAEIAAAIAQANRLADPLDVLVVGRGGGSMEDLWCFNEEPVVRALAESNVPTISAVGHEIDVTLADLAADVRALTPSEAAERAVPSADEVIGGVRMFEERLHGLIERRIEMLRDRTDALARRPVFERPREGVRNLSRQVDEIASRLKQAMQQSTQNRQSQLATFAGKLEVLSPLGVLSRGYSLTQRESNGELLSSSATVKVGELLKTRLAKGTITSRVEGVETT
ncbi:exodeoxyribonuclease VII large subunit [Adhaeretor mobilis]|uniref:Exodeoxyribonuclease 7 large subunit n=1 Tax=Adhaeretor mobilis TaxID=1930276 RepID=A0A517N039_9BACT|nr:exodeoxyribonuclease VII large subunit [Adhaeretor mobilis]QDT00507.1 Exodeoxyribonuclease 7 large subunit [Adhaeretor mobilis]